MPFEEARSSAAQFCNALSIHFPEMNTNELQLLGSSISVRYRGRYFVLATRHQLLHLGVTDSTLPRVGQISLDRQMFVTSAGHFTSVEYSAPLDDDRNDMIAFFFDKQVEEYPEFRNGYVDLVHPWDAKSDEILRCFAVGYAYCDQGFDLFQRRQLDLVRRNISCAYESSPSAQAVRRVRELSISNLNPDGMSGGGIYFIRRAVNLFKLEFGGMIQRGGNSYFHYVDAVQIGTFLDAAIRSDA